MSFMPLNFGNNYNVMNFNLLGGSNPLQNPLQSGGQGDFLQRMLGSFLEGFMGFNPLEMFGNQQNYSHCGCCCGTHGTNDVLNQPGIRESYQSYQESRDGLLNSLREMQNLNRQMDQLGIPRGGVMMDVLNSNYA